MNASVRVGTGRAARASSGSMTPTDITRSKAIFLFKGHKTVNEL
jgi:hypothetical protein